MKTIKSILLISCILLVFAGCKKDNYATPGAGIHGALIDGETGGTLELSEAGNNSTVRMLVNDPAKYPAPTPFDLAVKADGTYANSLIFAEIYKVFPLAQSGPWQYLANDSVKVVVANGQNPQVNFKVVPFFRITASVSDTTVNFTVTKSTTTTVANNLTANNNLLIMINNYNIVDESVCSNTAGQYYQNQFQYTISNAALGVPQTQTIPFAATHLAKGVYYIRVAVIGNGSNGKYNYSPVMKTTVQ